MLLRIPEFKFDEIIIPRQRMAFMPKRNFNILESRKKALYSCTLRDRRALYHIGCLEKLSSYNFPHRTDIIIACKSIYNHHQRKLGDIVIYKDAIDFSDTRTQSSDFIIPENSICVRYFRNIAGFKKTKKGWKVLENELTESEYCYLPMGTGHWIIPSGDNIFNKFSGIPLNTTFDKEKAIRSWNNAGYENILAEKQLSTFYRRDLGKGVATVISKSCLDGPFCIVLTGDPADMNFSISYLPTNYL